MDPVQLHGRRRPPPRIFGPPIVVAGPFRVRHHARDALEDDSTPSDYVAAREYRQALRPILYSHNIYHAQTLQDQTLLLAEPVQRRADVLNRLVGGREFMDSRCTLDYHHYDYPEPPPIRAPPERILTTDYLSPHNWTFLVFINSQRVRIYQEFASSRGFRIPYPYQYQASRTRRSPRDEEQYRRYWAEVSNRMDAMTHYMDSFDSEVHDIEEEEDGLMEERLMQARFEREHRMRNLLPGPGLRNFPGVPPLDRLGPMTPAIPSGPIDWGTLQAFMESVESENNEDIRPETLVGNGQDVGAGLGIDADVGEFQPDDGGDWVDRREREDEYETQEDEMVDEEAEENEDAGDEIKDAGEDEGTESGEEDEEEEEGTKMEDGKDDKPDEGSEMGDDHKNDDGDPMVDDDQGEGKAMGQQQQSHDFAGLETRDDIQLDYSYYQSATPGPAAGDSDDDDDDEGISFPSDSRSTTTSTRPRRRSTSDEAGITRRSP